MSRTSIHDLLELSPDVSKPHAYQVFGLTLGEPDAGVIKQAIATRIGALKQAKATTDPKVWAQAAKVVQSAQKTLQDPKQKAALDARFGIVAEAVPSTSPTATTPTQPPAPASTDGAAPYDPLADLLPPSNPLAATPPTPLTPPAAQGEPPQPIAPPPPPVAAVPPVPATTQPIQQPPAPQPTSEQPTYEQPANEQPANEQSAAPAPVAPVPVAPATPAPVVRSRRPVRRRRSWSGPLMMFMLLLMLGSVVGGMAYFFLKGPGELQFVKTDDGFTIRTGGTDPEDRQPKVFPVSDTDREDQGDGVLKPPRGGGDPDRDTLANEMNAIESMTSVAGMSQPNADSESSGTTAATPNMTMSDTQPDTNAPPEMEPEPTTPVPPATAEPDPPMAKEPTPEDLAAGKAALDTARQAIKTAKWDNMKQLTEVAQTKSANDQQSKEAESLYQLADLATFYRGAVSKAMEGLPTANEFKLTPTMAVIVVEASSEKLVFRRGAKNYDYTLDKLPLIVAHALAPFKLKVDSPTGQAAKAAYQALSPLATEEHRKESTDILRGLDGVEGADPKAIADIIESLF